MTISVKLPWPNRLLHPNARPHWAAKARATKAARSTAWAITLEALKGVKLDWRAAKLHWVFHPKTAHAVDDDGAESSCKSYRDGIADALGIDDANFKATREIGPPIKGGAVIVQIEEA